MPFKFLSSNKNFFVSLVYFVFVDPCCPSPPSASSSVRALLLRYSCVLSPKKRSRAPPLSVFLALLSHGASFLARAGSVPLGSQKPKCPCPLCEFALHEGTWPWAVFPAFPLP